MISTLSVIISFIYLFVPARFFFIFVYADQATLPVIGIIGVGDTAEERSRSARLEFFERNAALEQGRTLLVSKKP
jgi:hypothetical protein